MLGLRPSFGRNVQTPSLAMTQAFNSTMMHGHTVIVGAGGNFLLGFRERKRHGSNNNRRTLLRSTIMCALVVATANAGK